MSQKRFSRVPVESSIHFGPDPEHSKPATEVSINHLSKRQVALHKRTAIWAMALFWLVGWLGGWLVDCFTSVSYQTLLCLTLTRAMLDMNVTSSALFDSAIWKLYPLFVRKDRFLNFLKVIFWIFILGSLCNCSFSVEQYAPTDPQHSNLMPATGVITKLATGGVKYMPGSIRRLLHCLIWSYKG